MLLGLETFSYHLALRRSQMDIFGFIERTQELGLDGVQVNIGPAINSFGHLGSDDPGFVREVRAAVESAGFFNEIDTRDTDYDFLTRVLKLCSAIGADVLRLYAAPDGDVSEGLQRAATDLARIVPVCADLGIRIAFENHEHETSEEILTVVRQVDSPWVGTLVDTGNAIMVWEDPVDAVRDLAHFAVSPHLKDQVVYEEAGETVVAGVTLVQGSTNCEESFRILAEESPLERINIEVCYDYRAPFRRPMGPDAQSSSEAFCLIEGPHDPRFIAPPQTRRTPDEDQKMVAWQDDAVCESVRFVKELDANLSGPPA